MPVPRLFALLSSCLGSTGVGVTVSLFALDAAGLCSMSIFKVHSHAFSFRSYMPLLDCTVHKPWELLQSLIDAIRLYHAYAVG